MEQREPKPEVEWDDLHESTDFRKLWVGTQNGRRLRVNVRMLSYAIEVWVQEEGTQPHTRGTFHTIDMQRFETQDRTVEHLNATKERLTREGWTLEIVKRQHDSSRHAVLPKPSRLPAGDKGTRKAVRKLRPTKRKER